MSCNSLEFQRVLNVWLIKFFVLPLDTDVNRKSFPMRPAAIWRRPSGFFLDDLNPTPWVTIKFSPILSSLHHSTNYYPIINAN